MSLIGLNFRKRGPDTKTMVLIVEVVGTDGTTINPAGNMRRNDTCSEYNASSMSSGTGTRMPHCIVSSGLYSQPDSLGRYFNFDFRSILANPFSMAGLSLVPVMIINVSVEILVLEYGHTFES